MNLIDWIVTSDDILAPLRDATVFSRAAIASHGAAVAWDEHDLAIDARHLKKLADGQRPVQ